jgi:hypothetical protein
MKRTFYWTVAILALISSLYSAKTVLTTNILLLLVFSLIAFMGYLSQEKINQWMKSIFSKIYNVFSIQDVILSKWISKFQKYTIGIATTCFWGAIGVDLTTHFVTNGVQNLNIKIDLPLYDLSVFVVYLGVIPQFIWTFNYGINKTLEKKKSNNN